jgi:ATP-dependent Lon protease
VLPIGGVKEKTIAAQRAGIRHIVFPKARRVCRVLCVRARVHRVHVHVHMFMFMSPACVHACMHCVHSQANKRDYDELPDNLREGITAHFAERYEEVYEIAFAEDD